MEDKNLVLLKIQDEQGFIIDGQVEYFSPSWPEWILEFTSPITKKLYFTATDVFECLTQLRLELAKYGYKPLCNGARLNVYPSGMCRDMGSGLCAYVFTPDKQVDSEDLVDIFDYAEPDSIASVEEQFNYYGSLFSRKHELKIQDRNGSIFAGIVSESGILEPNKMKFTSPMTSDIEAYGKSNFECLTNFRIELEKHGFLCLCSGARFDTYTLSEYGIFVNRAC